MLGELSRVGVGLFKKHLFLSNLSISFALSGLGDIIQQNIEQVSFILYSGESRKIHKEPPYLCLQNYRTVVFEIYINNTQPRPRKCLNLT